MILEAFICHVKSGQEAGFETALKGALHLISSSKGFISLEMQRCIEVTGQYILLIRWETLEDHTVGFRGSAAYQEWRAALHHFYDPMPTVQHYEAVDLG
jgi:heme-degrading monooxygenase HmoA